MNDSIFIAELEGLIAPDPVGFWPPAPLWFVVGGLLFGLVVAAAVTGWLRYRKRTYRREALSMLEELMELTRPPDAGGLTKLNILLKKVALRSYLRETIAGLEGEHWIAFLNHSTGRIKLEGREAGLLLADRLKKTSGELIDQEAWMGLCRFAAHWIKHHKSTHDLNRK